VDEEQYIAGGEAEDEDKEDQDQDTHHLPVASPLSQQPCQDAAVRCDHKHEGQAKAQPHQGKEIVDEEHVLILSWDDIMACCDVQA